MKNIIGKTVKKVVILQETNVLARNYPTEKKPYALRLLFTDDTHFDIEVDAKGYFSDFTYFLKLT